MGIKQRIDSGGHTGYTDARTMKWLQMITAAGGILVLQGCLGGMNPWWHEQNSWKAAVDRQVGDLGYRNWIVIAEASFPAHSRPGVRQVYADEDIPVVVDHVLNVMERTENLRPGVYLTREMRSVENDFAPGIEAMRGQIHGSLHGYEPVELDQNSLLTLLEDTSRSFDVLVIRTRTAMPYCSVFLELQPGYWDAESEDRLRKRIQDERMRMLAPR